MDTIDTASTQEVRRISRGTVRRVIRGPRSKLGVDKEKCDALRVRYTTEVRNRLYSHRGAYARHARQEGTVPDLKTSRAMIEFSKWFGGLDPWEAPIEVVKRFRGHRSRALPLLRKVRRGEQLNDDQRRDLFELLTDIPFRVPLGVKGWVRCWLYYYAGCPYGRQWVTPAQIWAGYPIHRGATYQVDRTAWKGVKALREQRRKELRNQYRGLVQLMTPPYTSFPTVEDVEEAKPDVYQELHVWRLYLQRRESGMIEELKKVTQKMYTNPRADDKKRWKFVLAWGRALEVAGFRPYFTKYGCVIRVGRKTLHGQSGDYTLGPFEVMFCYTGRISARNLNHDSWSDRNTPHPNMTQRATKDWQWSQFCTGQETGVAYSSAWREKDPKRLAMVADLVESILGTYPGGTPYQVLEGWQDTPLRCTRCRRVVGRRYTNRQRPDAWQEGVAKLACTNSNCSIIDHTLCAGCAQKSGNCLRCRTKLTEVTE